MARYLMYESRPLWATPMLLSPASGRLGEEADQASSPLALVLRAEEDGNLPLGGLG